MGLSLLSAGATPEGASIAHGDDTEFIQYISANKGEQHVEVYDEDDSGNNADMNAPGSPKSPYVRNVKRALKARKEMKKTGADEKKQGKKMETISSNFTQATHNTK